MSTPSEKLPHLVDLATHAARQARQAQPAAPDRSVESADDNRPRSPYAPKPPEERAAARLRVLARDDTETPESVVAAYAPKRARSSGADAVANSDTHSIAPAAKTLKQPPAVALAEDASRYASTEDAPRL